MLVCFIETPSVAQVLGPSLSDVSIFSRNLRLTGSIRGVKWLTVPLLLIVAPAIAEDIETLDHRVYRDAKVTRAEPDGLTVMHSAGIAKIPFEELSDDLRAKYHYDAAAAQSYGAQQRQRAELRARQTGAVNNAATARNALAAAQSLKEGEAAAERRAIGNFSLSAHETAGGTSSYDTWRTDYGSYDRTTAAGKSIQVSVRDMGGNSAICRVDVYFVAKSLTENVHFIYADQQATVRVDHGIEATTTVPAPALGSRVLNLAALGRQYAEGAEIEGWIATGSIKGQVFGMVSSNQIVGNGAEGLLAKFKSRGSKAGTPPKR